MEGRGVLLDLIKNVGQLELADVPVERWIIYPDVCGLLDGPDDVLHLPTHFEKLVHADVITRGVTMVIEGEGALRCSLNLSPKGLAN